MRLLIILLLAYLAVDNIESEESARSIDVKTPTQWQRSIPTESSR